MSGFITVTVSTAESDQVALSINRRSVERRLAAVLTLLQSLGIEGCPETCRRCLQTVAWAIRWQNRPASAVGTFVIEQNLHEPIKDPDAGVNLLEASFV
ncbi:MAG TPA: hypothetical protein VNO52_15275 [Methylomirabilota bacterium]|nr:hypothetical protein [Methylomirabilota bacterium]